MDIDCLRTDGLKVSPRETRRDTAVPMLPGLGVWAVSLQVIALLLKKNEIKVHTNCKVLRKLHLNQRDRIGWTAGEQQATKGRCSWAPSGPFYGYKGREAGN